MNNKERLPSVDDQQAEGVEDAMTQRLEKIVEPAEQLAELRREVETNKVDTEPVPVDQDMDISAASVSTEATHDAINTIEAKAESNNTIEEATERTEEEGSERVSSGAGESTVV